VAEERPVQIGVERAQPGKRRPVIRPTRPTGGVHPPQHRGQPRPGRDTIPGQIQVLHRLQQRGHEVFLDQDPRDGIEIGEEWQQRLHERLRWADAVVWLLTSAYVSSTWCTAEVSIAQSRGSRLLPIRAEPGVCHVLGQPPVQLIGQRRIRAGMADEHPGHTTPPADTPRTTDPPSPARPTTSTAPSAAWRSLRERAPDPDTSQGRNPAPDEEEPAAAAERRPPRCAAGIDRKTRLSARI
jgi:hypothetical protein